jgi:hypothetical protein
MELRDRETCAQNQPILPPVKKNRFRLVRLEDRIAPGGPPTLEGITATCSGAACERGPIVR